MSYLPSELLREIFLRLPAESLLRLRRVCKQWLLIIDDSSFIKHHTQNQQNSHTLLVKNGREGPLYSFSLDSLNFINGPQFVDAINVKQSDRQWTLYSWTYCNGLILMDYRDITENKNWVIWNPLTNECREVELPRLSGASKSKSCRCALGYDYDADDYKVVKIDEFGFPPKVVYQTLVYSLKSGSWRMIEGCPESMDDCNVGNTCFNGTLYWPSKDTIIALDVGTEKFSELPLPLVDRSDFDVATWFKLDGLDGSLICSLDYNKRKTLYGWVMKDKSWIKLFSLEYYVPKLIWKLWLVAYLKGKQQVVLQHNKGFVWFDFGTNSVKKFSIHGFPGIDSAIIFPGSLVRLNVRDSGIGMGDVATKKILSRKRKRKTERNTARLKFCVRKFGGMCCSDKSSCNARECLLCRHEEDKPWEKSVAD